ncbi:MAG: ABC transporter ATP-binding protein [Actinobacteria bacterium]|nr:ABC transporter ATP-binding protein [Actinomycetota bacterium]
MEHVLAVRGLYKSYPVRWRRARREALRGLNLEVPRGSIFGLLGPNGAGKTTTLKIIMGLARPDAGSFTVLGEEGTSPRARARMGFLPEQPYFELYLTPRRLLSYYGRLAGMDAARIRERCSHLMNLVGLADAADLPLEKFSKGMLQRVGLAQAMLAEPEFLVLDEPSTGLDPLGKVQVREILAGLREGGTTILLSSHQLSEIEEICDRVAVVAAGKNVASGSLDELLRSGDELEIRLRRAVGEETPALPPSATWNADRTGLFVRRGELNPALHTLIAAGLEVEEVRPRRMTLEEFFVSRVGGAGEGGWR